MNRTSRELREPNWSIDRCDPGNRGPRRLVPRGGAAAGLAVAVLLTATVVGLAPVAAGALPSAGLGTGTGYCTSYAGGHASSFHFDNVWACQGSTTGTTTFDEPGPGTYAWQCVELSARFLWAVDGIWAGPGTGYEYGSQLVGRIHALHPSIKVGSPGPESVPAPGDVASFGPGGAVDATTGHTAVVIASNPSAGTFQTMSENFPDGAAGEQNWKIDLSGHHDGSTLWTSYVGGGGGPPRGRRRAGSISAWAAHR